MKWTRWEPPEWQYKECEISLHQNETKPNEKPKPVPGKNYKNHNSIKNYLIFKNVPKIMQQMNKYLFKKICSLIK